MARRSKPAKREALPDVRYDSVHLQSFINRMVTNGKTSTGAHAVYLAFDLIEERTKRPQVGS